VTHFVDTEKLILKLEPVITHLRGLSSEALQKSLKVWNSSSIKRLELTPLFSLLSQFLSHYFLL